MTWFLKKKKSKAWILVGIMTVIIFTMATTSNGPAPIDGIFKSIGLSPWTKSMHVSVFVMLIPMFISIMVVEVYAVGKCGIKRRYIFIVFICLSYVLFKGGEAVHGYQKSIGHGIHALEFKNSKNRVSYEISNGEVTSLVGTIKIKNYSSSKVSFKLQIPVFEYESEINEKSNMIILKREDGSEVIFNLEPNESRTIVMERLNIIGELENPVKITTTIHSFGIEKIIIISNGEKSILTVNKRGYYIEI